jgi:hypothetical protein
LRISVSAGQPIEVLAEALNHKDVRVRMVAAMALIERGYGRPEQKADATVTHKFAEHAHRRGRRHDLPAGLQAGP